MMEYHEEKNSLKSKSSSQYNGYRPTPQFAGAMIILSVVAASMFSVLSYVDPKEEPTKTAAKQAPPPAPTAD